VSWKAHYHQIVEGVQPNKIYSREYLTKTVSQLVSKSDLEILASLPTNRSTAEQKSLYNKTWCFSHDTLRRAVTAGKLNALDSNHPDLFRGQSIIEFVNAEMKVAA